MAGAGRHGEGRWQGTAPEGLGAEGRTTERKEQGERFREQLFPGVYSGGL